MKKSPFIQGFKQPTLSSNSYFLLSDVRGNGQGNLVIWAEDRSQLIVYKGSNRDVQKSSKIKNVNCIIDYYDEESNTLPAIALAAENALYIFRGLVESFRLKIPDVIAEVQQQLMWTKFKDNPTQLAAELANIKSSFLSQKAKYYLGASSDERRKEIIETVFQQGISQKDSISAVAVIKQTDGTGIGNIVIGTELNRLYILDNFGHKILHERVIDFAPCMIFAYGKMETKYVIICVSRQGTISIYVNTDKNDPSQSIRLNTWITTADLSYPEFAIATSDQVVSFFSFSNSNLKISVPKYSYKVNQKPLKVLWMKKKGVKLLLIGFQNQFRIMREKQIIYRYETDFKLSSFLYGSFAREQSCLVLLYENKGFQVLIGHRLFNPKENYQTRKIGNIDQAQVQEDAIQIPKKTSHFLKYMNSQPDTLQQFKMYERSMKLLKWSTLKGKVSQKISSTAKIEINPKILGLGPIFIIKLEIENVSNEPIFNIKIIISQQNDLISLIKFPETINMLPPFIPTLKEIELKSISLKAERFKVDLSWKGNIASTIVCLPACQQMGD